MPSEKEKINQVNYCKGCNEYHDTGCSFINHNRDGTCPCTECVVKTMCLVSCDSYDEWTNLKWMER